MKDYFNKVLKTSYAITLNLQKFSDGEGSDGSDGSEDGGSEGAEGTGSEDKNKTFTRDQLAQIAHGQVQDALKKQAKQHEKELEEARKQAETEAEQYANASDEKKKEIDAKKKQSHLDKREADITRRELKAAAIKTLSDESYPVELADVLDYTDHKTVESSIEAVKTAFDKAVSSEVDKRIAKGSHTPGGTGSGGKKNTAGSTGKRLAESRKKQSSKKKTYFE